MDRLLLQASVEGSDPKVSGVSESKLLVLWPGSSEKRKRHDFMIISSSKGMTPSNLRNTSLIFSQWHHPGNEVFNRLTFGGVNQCQEEGKASF